MTDEQEQIDIEGFDEDTFDPTMVLMEALVAKTKGEPVNEPLVNLAVMTIGAASLMNKGLTEDQAIDAINQAMDHGDIKITWNNEDGLTISVGDGIVAE